MTALTLVQPQQQAVAAPAFTMGEMERIALAIAKGGLFGSTDPNAVLTLCMLAQAENKHPALIMQNYHIISGKPAKKAEAMLVDFLSAGGKVVWHRLDDECADATFSHPLGGEVRIIWDDKRVQQAQLTGNAMHKKYPRQMKRSRCISEGVRTVFPGATAGLYVPEEVEAFDDRAPAPTPMTSAPKPTASPKRGAAVRGEPVDGGDLQAAAPVEQPQPEPEQEAPNPSARALELQDAIRGATNEVELRTVWLAWRGEVATWPDPIKQAVTAKKDERKAELSTPRDAPADEGPGY